MAVDSAEKKQPTQSDQSLSSALYLAKRQGGKGGEGGGAAASTGGVNLEVEELEQRIPFEQDTVTSAGDMRKAARSLIKEKAQAIKSYAKQAAKEMAKKLAKEAVKKAAQAAVRAVVQFVVSAVGGFIAATWWVWLILGLAILLLLLIYYYKDNIVEGAQFLWSNFGDLVKFLF